MSVAPVSPKILNIVERLEESTLDLSEAKTQPRECYVDEDWYRFEKEAVFARSWLCLGRVDCVKKPGDYVRIDHAEEPLIIVKDYDNEIRVLSAVCAHRGHIVAEGKGNCGKVLRCPLHYWSYGLDGRLITAPSMSETFPLDALRKEAYLPQLKVEIWHGFIFANMDPNAEPLAPTLWRLEREIERHNLGDMVTAQEIDFTGNQWNWKGMLENGLEPYHTSYLHMTLHDFAHARLAGFTDWEDDEGAIFHPTGFYHLDGGFNATEKALFPAIPTLTEADRKQVIFGAVPPTLFIGALPDLAFYFLVLPTGPSTHNVRAGWIYSPETTNLPMFPYLHEATVQGHNTIILQDTPANASVQRGARSRFRRPGRYCYQEETLLQWNRWLLKRYKAYLAEVAAEEPVGVQT